MSGIKGKVQTVLGPINPDALGVTLTHEHLTIEFVVAKQPMPENSLEADSGKGPWWERSASRETMPCAMDTMGWVNQYVYSNVPNLTLEDEHQAVIEEMKFFKKSGGQTVVDNTTIGIHRDMKYLKQVALESGVNIIAGAGYYVDAAHPKGMSKKTVEEISVQIQKELLEGADGTDIKCGVIGEIGCSWPLTANEKKVLQASAQTQAVTGCPVIIHPGRNEEAPEEIVRVLQEAGGDIGKTVMSHIDRTIFTEEELLEFASLGSYLEYDLFGTQMVHYQPNPRVDMQSDNDRIRFIKLLIDEGYGDKVVVAHDVHTKHRLMKYGGHGFSHLLLNIVPKMKMRGYTAADIQKILVSNPKAWLTYTK